MALNALTGEASTGFGQNGSVDIKVPWNGVPLIYKTAAILGAYNAEISQGGPDEITPHVRHGSISSDLTLAIVRRWLAGHACRNDREHSTQMPFRRPGSAGNRPIDP